MRVYLIGEANPYSLDPTNAMLLYPERSAGARLCHTILGMTEEKYLRIFSRLNPCGHLWNAQVARVRAALILAECEIVSMRGVEVGLILLGRKVWDAFYPGQDWIPFSRRDWVLALPHPSGRSRLWNQAAFENDPIKLARWQVSNLIHEAPWWKYEP